MNKRTVGLILIAISIVMLAIFIPKANANFWTYTYTLKFSCHGPCQTTPSERAKKYVNFEQMQELNKRKLYEHE